MRCRTGAGMCAPRCTIRPLPPRHLNFFRNERELAVRLRRVKLPDSKVALINLPGPCRPSGSTLLFEAFVLLLARQTTSTGISRISRPSIHRVKARCEKYANVPVRTADLNEVRRVVVDETSCTKGREYMTPFAAAAPDPAHRLAIFNAEGKDSTTVEPFEAN